MSNNALIHEVKEAIGPALKEDTPLDPTAHKKLLEDRAPSIACILGGSAVHVAAKQQRVAAAPAREAQRTFRRQSSRAAWLVVVAATASAAIMVTGSVFPETSVLRQVLSIILAIIGMAAAMGAATLFRIIHGTKLLEIWMESRAMAETKRLEYFAKVASAPTGLIYDDLRPGFP